MLQYSVFHSPLWHEFLNLFLTEPSLPFAPWTTTWISWCFLYSSIKYPSKLCQYGVKMCYAFISNISITNETDTQSNKGYVWVIYLLTFSEYNYWSKTKDLWKEWSKNISKMFVNNSLIILPLYFPCIFKRMWHLYLFLVELFFD